MKIYHYDMTSGEFIGVSDARTNPAFGDDGQPEYLVPAYATTTAPPATVVRETVMFSNGDWHVLPDLRGVEAWDQDGREVVVSEAGKSLVELGLFSTKPTPTPEQIAANQAAKAAQDVKTISDKEAQLWAAADAYATGQISGVAIGILAIGVMQQKPKSLAISAWSKSLWDEYYIRKAGITATSVLDLDFSRFGEMPYTVPELSAEVGL